MAGADELEAKQTLAAMMERLGRGPNAALNVPPGASVEVVRTAFHALTKQYHPARFGRMDAEIQRFANEVFLGIKAAHDTLRDSAPAVPTDKRTTSPGMVALRNEGTQPRASEPLRPPMRPATMPGPISSASGRVQSTKPLPLIAEKTPPPTVGAPLVAKRDPGAKTPPLEVRRTPAKRPNGDFDDTETRQGMPNTFQPPARPMTGPIGRLDPATTMPPAPSVAVALELIANRQWDAAKVALNALGAMSPDSRHVRALVAFATGRQAQVEGRVDEARVELQRALQYDPELAAAKTALGELFARRR